MVELSGYPQTGRLPQTSMVHQVSVEREKDLGLLTQQDERPEVPMDAGGEHAMG